MSLRQNLENIPTKIAEATKRAGRPEESVRLVAVSKTVNEAAIQEMFAQGQTVFAENRAQSFRDKTRNLSDLSIEWHFIGPLQSNKIKYVFPLASLVHSIDRVEILDHFAQWHTKTGRKCPCLLEVHVSDEKTKHGFAPDEVPRVIEKYRNNEHLDICGMMGMAPFVDDEKIVRESFRTLKQLFDKSQDFEGAAYQAKELSMGMTNDFVIAIEEGATLVRIGTALFSGE